MYLNSKVITLLWVCFCACACDSPDQVAHEEAVPPELFRKFVSKSPTDTVVVNTVFPSDSAGRTASADLWYQTLGADLLDEVAFGLDTMDTEGYTYWKTLIDRNTELCLMGFHQFWYRNKSLLIYDIPSASFKGLIPVATFYGGDGGQILTGAWLYDINEDGFADLTIRESEHNLEPGEPEPVDIYKDAVRQMLWDTADQAFKPLIEMDSSALIKKFPLPWWETS